MSVSLEEVRKMVAHGVHDAMEKEAQRLSEGTDDIADHVAHCPNCYPTVIKKMKRDSEFWCEDCGLPLGSREMAEKIKECPNCGSTDAYYDRREDEE